MPERIQRKRTRGWRMPENTVYVGRGTRWGNPYKFYEFIYVDGPDDPITPDMVKQARQIVCELFEEGIEDGDLDNLDGTTLAEWLEPLRGKNLACWCPPGQPCHADILLRLANTACTGLATPSAQLSGLAQPANQ